MIIRQVELWHLKCSFRSPFKHRQAAYRGSDNLVVRLLTAEGTQGYGEGVPREFVTGESLEQSLHRFQEDWGPALVGLEIPAPAAVLPTLAALAAQFPVTAAPALFCALETALLDAAGRTFGLSLGTFFGPVQSTRVIYSAVLPLASDTQMSRLLQLVRSQKMRFVKLKVGGEDDLGTLARVREELGSGVDLRVDANGAWSPSEAIQRLRGMAPFRISAVEQPVAKQDLEGLRRVQEALDIPVIADESLCTPQDAEKLISLGACRIFNLRLSKVGGLTRARQLKEMADRAGLGCQLGCHVGETSILAAAGRHFACSSGPLVYLEGSFAPFLLTQDPVEEPVSFGPGGLAAPLPGPGLGIQVREDLLQEMAIRHISLP